MSRPKDMKRNGLLASLAVVLILGALGCSTDSPTAPHQVAADPPSTGANSWRISINVSPDELAATSPVPATVKVTVESRSDGSSPASGTTMTLSTSLGDFDSQGSGVRSIGVSLVGGKATALLFAGDVVANGTVTGRLAGSTGQDGFQVVGEPDEPQDPFITALFPNVGPESGGTTVNIEGVNFVEPLRVTFQVSGAEKLADVQSVTATTIRVVTPVAPDMNLAPCDSVGDGITDGVRKIDSPALVQVTYLAPDGTQKTGSLDGAYTYLTDTSVCVPTGNGI